MIFKQNENTGLTVAILPVTKKLVTSQLRFFRFKNPALIQLFLDVYYKTFPKEYKGFANCNRKDGDEWNEIEGQKVAREKALKNFNSGLLKRIIKFARLLGKGSEDADCLEVDFIDCYDLQAEANEVYGEEVYDIA